MTNWRTIGNVTPGLFHDVLKSAGSPLAKISGDCYDAAGSHTALCLAMLRAESSYWTRFRLNVKENNNPLNLRPPDGNGYMEFLSPVAGIRAWRERITSPTYKDAIYAKTTTIAELIHRYAPNSDGNSETDYVRSIESDLARWGITGATPMAELVFGNCKHPPFLDRPVLNSETAAYNDLGKRRALGVCQHSMVGTLWGTDGWFRRGRGISTGLTDYGIGGSTDGAFDGVIIRWNDPLGRRSGWANGGSDGLEGDGPLFVRTLGIDAINRDLVSIERSDGGNTNTPMSPKQFESICQLSAYWFDQAHVPWDRFPLNPAVKIVTHMLHLEFATKNCPFPPVTNQINQIQNRIRAIMKAAQTKVVEETTPPVIEPTPDHAKWPYPLEELKEQFGSFEFLYKSGRVKPAEWDDQGAISNAWAARAAKDKIKVVADIPPPLAGFEAIDKQGNVQTVVLFDGKGTNTWQLTRARIGAVWEWTK